MARDSADARTRMLKAFFLCREAARFWGSRSSSYVTVARGSNHGLAKVSWAARVLSCVLPRPSTDRGEPMKANQQSFWSSTTSRTAAVLVNHAEAGLATRFSSPALTRSLRVMGESPVDLSFTRLRMPKRLDGINCLLRCERWVADSRDRGLPAFGSIRVLVEAMKGGAIDLHVRPFDFAGSN